MMIVENILFYCPPCRIRNFFSNYFEAKNLITADIEKAKYILLPFNYELIYDYSEQELEQYNICYTQLIEMKEYAKQLDELSWINNKKLVVFFYRDPELDLPLKNALIFRTSARKSNKREFVFGMPAFVEHKPSNSSIVARTKESKPHVSFRGLAAPIKLPITVSTKVLSNRILTKLGIDFKFKVWYNEGYLLRRTAIRSILEKSDYFFHDFIVNADYKTKSPLYVKDYVGSFIKNEYFICASGHGNYSFRLYEVMREARFPVFIDTDCLLPCADDPNWRELLLWVPKNEASRTAEIILDFHASIHPDDFIDKQIKIRKFWENRLSLEGFSNYILEEIL